MSAPNPVGVLLAHGMALERRRREWERQRSWQARSQAWLMVILAGALAWAAVAVEARRTWRALSAVVVRMEARP